MDVHDALVLGDPFRIGQVMNNLLSNAVKFTREGDSICVNVSQMEATSGEFCKYRLMIADNRHRHVGGLSAAPVRAV